MTNYKGKTVSQHILRSLYIHCTYRCLLLTIIRLALLTYTLLYIFHPEVKGLFQFYVRTHLPYLDDVTATFSLPYFSETDAKVCVLQSYDIGHKEKYAEFIKRNKEWAEVNRFEYHEYLAEFHQQRLQETSGGTHKVNVNHVDYKEKPHYLKFHGMQYLLFDEGGDCDYVMYIDSDAVIGVSVDDDTRIFNKEEGTKNSGTHTIMGPPAINFAPIDSSVDIVFGNELFVAALQSMKYHPLTLPFNSGYMLVKKTKFSKQFIHDMLHHPRCDKCRAHPCTIFLHYDQGCMEKLFAHEYYDIVHGNVQTPKIMVARVQDTKLTKGFLLCHLAGQNKILKEGACNSI